MKILYVYRDLCRNGGIPHQTRRLVGSLASLGHDVFTLSLEGELQAQFCRENPRVSVRTIGRGFSGVMELRRYLKKYAYDMAHFTGLWVPLQQWWAREFTKAKVPYVVSTHGHASPIGMNVRFGDKPTFFYHLWAKRLWHRWANLPLLKGSIGVHVHSRYEAEIIHSAGIPKTFIAPPGIDYEWLNSKCYLRRRLHKRITFLHLGRLDIYHKGLDVICAATSRLTRAGLADRYKFILVGPSVYKSRETLQNFADSSVNGILEIRDGVWGKDKLDLWEEADYFLNLYRFAGIALAPCEAVGTGLPLFASREGNLGDWTTDIGMGWTVPLNVDDFFSLLIKIMNLSEPYYAQMSDKAWNFARANSWTAVGKKMVDSYSNLLN